MKDKTLLCVIFLTIFLCSASFTFAGNKVKASIPSSPVVLNEQTIDSTYQQYPFLLYKDITYVPMTYYHCNLLGLQSEWNEKDGLVIHKRGLDTPGEYYEPVTAKWNNMNPNATISTVKITVNGKDVDNKKEEHPLLHFRDVTYFPLTWRFGVEEFGWDYHFDNANGLVIKADSNFITKEGLYFFEDKLKIFIKTGFVGLGGPASGNLMVTQNGQTKAIGKNGDTFGYGTEPSKWNTGNILSVKDGWIYTTRGDYWKEEQPQKCKVNIQTEEIILLNE